MANEIKVTIGADTKQADRAVKSFREKLDGVAGKARGAGLALSAMGAVGVVAITNFAQAALTQQAAVDSLGRAVENAGGNFAGIKDRVLEVTAALQQKTNYGDEAQIRVLTQLVPMLGNTEDALAALPAVMEVAAATGKDLESTVATIGPVLAGVTDRVRGTSLEFDKSQGPMERTAIIMETLGGIAEAQANPFTQLGMAVGDLKETIGGQLLPIITPLINKIQEFAERLQNANPTVVKIGVAVLALATAIGVIGGPILLLIGLLPTLAVGFAAVSAAAAPVTLTILGIAAAVAGVILIFKNWNTIVETIGSLWSATWEKVTETFRTAVNLIIGYINLYLSAAEKIVNFFKPGADLSLTIDKWEQNTTEGLETVGEMAGETAKSFRSASDASVVSFEAMTTATDSWVEAIKEAKVAAEETSEVIALTADEIKVAMLNLGDVMEIGFKERFVGGMEQVKEAIKEVATEIEELPEPPPQFIEMPSLYAESWKETEVSVRQSVNGALQAIASLSAQTALEFGSADIGPGAIFRMTGMTGGEAIAHGEGGAIHAAAAAANARIRAARAGISSHAHGGFIPGPEGAPRLAQVHGGELVLNRAQQSKGLGGITINITGNNITGELEMDRIVRRALASAGVRGAI